MSVPAITGSFASLEVGVQFLYIHVAPANLLTLLSKHVTASDFLRGLCLNQECSILNSGLNCQPSQTLATWVY